MRLHIPPECQGQIVEEAFGWADDGQLVCRTHDRGACETTWWVARNSKALRSWHGDCAQSAPPRAVTWRKARPEEAKAWTMETTPPWE